MSDPIFKNIWDGSTLVDETHLEEVRRIFLNSIVEQDANLELEKSTSLSDFQRISTLKKYFNWISPQEYYQKFQKSAELSVQLREKANQFYKEGNLEQAMRGYNLAIAFGRFQESELGLAYGNRSAVFVNLKKPILAIRDISLALESKYPPELHEKLIQRRRKCKSMSNVNTSPDQTILLFHKHIFSLKSPSENVTHAEDFVQIDYDEKCGRRLVVTKEVPSGTALLVENPYVITLENELIWDTNHCHNCFVPILGGIPCPMCTFAVYCGKDCYVDAMKGHHRYEHNLLAYLHCHKMHGRELLALRIITTAGPDELYKLFKSNFNEQQNSTLSQLRGVKGNAVYGSSYAEIYSLIAHPDKLDLLEKVSNAFKAAILANILNESSDFFRGKLENEFVDFVASLLLRHLENIPYNSFSFSELRSDSNNSSEMPHSVPYATGLLPTISLVNHSCCPNAIHVKNPQFCKTAFVTVRKLFPGDEVYISYGPHFMITSRLERRAKLEDKYKFICQCEACNQNWPTSTLTLEDLMLSHKCPSSMCTSSSKTLCRYCLEYFKNLSDRCEQYENQLHQAHEYVKSGVKFESVKAFEILKHCLDNFQEFPPKFNLYQVAQDLLKRTLLACAQAEDV